MSPQRADVLIDDNSQAIRDDVDFVFTGFALSGKVLSSGSSEGPAGMLVTLSSKDVSSCVDFVE